MRNSEIAALRLSAQQIGNPTVKTPQELAGLMGAMQAQDYPMVKWAFGLRLPGITEKTVDNAMDRGDIIRTHILRPTWHFVSSSDLYWMMGLSSPRIKASLKYRQVFLGLTPDILQKSLDIIEAALSDGNHLTKEQVMDHLRRGGIDADSSSTYHLILWAELCGIVCSGKADGRRQTYALLSHRVPVKKLLQPGEAEGMLAGRYFRSHGPATIEDFIWWSGLTSSAARKGLKIAEPELIRVTSEGTDYWYARDTEPNAGSGSVFLVPAYDEYIISYRDRSAVLEKANNEKAISMNGVFRPVIVSEGMVVGLWKRSFRAERLIIEAEYFGRAGRGLKTAVEEAALMMGKFTEKKAEVNHKK